MTTSVASSTQTSSTVCGQRDRLPPRPMAQRASLSVRPKTHGKRFGSSSAKSTKSGDDWMGTYADAITLLMAFFVILLSTAKIDEAKYAKVANAIAQDLQHRDEPEAQPVAAPRIDRRHRL